MSKFSKAGQAGYEGYTVEKYSAENGQLRAGDKGTITYVRNLVSVVFDLSGGTWNNSLNNVNYNVVKGGSLDAAAIIHNGAIICKERLLFQDEIVRHKILDVIGDMYLCGRRVKANIIAIKPGHSKNVELAGMMIRQMSAQ